MKLNRKYHIRKRGTGKGKVRKNPLRRGCDRHSYNAFYPECNDCPRHMDDCDGVEKDNHPYKVRFQDIVMQKQYEGLIKGGMNWKRAEKKIINRFNEYDGY